MIFVPAAGTAAVKMCKNIDEFGWCCVRGDVCIRLEALDERKRRAPVDAPDGFEAAEEKEG